jgi:hypothetical protein
MDLEHIYQLPILNQVPTLQQEEESILIQYKAANGHGSDSKEYESTLMMSPTPGT